MSKKSLKIAIVGGGIAGLYCAWKLRDNTNYSVTLFEYLDHLGGRIETLDLDGFHAECGPMRFERVIQPRFCELMENLDLENNFKEFPPTNVVLNDYPKYKLEENEQYDRLDAKGNRVNASSLDLLKYGLYRIFNPDEEKRKYRISEVVEKEPLDGSKKATATELKRRSKIEIFADGRKPKHFHEYRTTFTLGDQPLHQLGIWNALARVLSPQAILKLREIGTFYHLIPENPSASEWGIFWLRLCRSDADLSTISGGVQTCIKKMEEHLRAANNVELITGAGVHKIDYGKTEGKIHLTVSRSHAGRSGLDLQFDHVILAIPKSPLRKLMELFPDEIRKYIHGVIGFPLLKAFVTLKEKWWETKPQSQQGAPSIPTREIHYFDNPQSENHLSSAEKKSATASQAENRSKVETYPNKAMIMLYTDRPATSYWSPYVKMPHQKAQTDMPLELKQELAERIYDLIKYEFKRVNDEFHELKELSKDDPSSFEEKLPEYAREWDFTQGKISQPDSQFTKKYYNLFEHVLISPEREPDLPKKARKEALEEISDNILSFAIRDWSKPPFSAANHAWSPGINVPEALKRLTAFSLMGRPGYNNLHICGEAYSDYQGFIEGALNSAQDVLDYIYKES